ncbi:RNA-DNA hybrid ribonuclease [Mortierella polycephala]|uniref:RNA-DNA hybrid ribonuclease n=1 Tax=Mortierella polycephala TaxID=41804 RepID=A0A9P6UA47_9FUNG|nr:RNA-DNA hybrid ribonuclease [Mortierella polycephala]
MQVYLEDLEEADAVEAVEAAVMADHEEATLPVSVSPSQALDPLYDPWSPPSVSHTPLSATLGPFGVIAETVAIEAFQQEMQMHSLESGTTPHLNMTQDGRGHGGLHDFQDIDDDEDDDEECLPPSETKYILYDDHVSPVSIAEALAVLNDPLHDDLFQGAMATTTEEGCPRSYSHSNSHFHSQSHSHAHSRPHPQSQAHVGTNPINSATNSSKGTQSVHAPGKGEAWNDVVALNDNASLRSQGRTETTGIRQWSSITGLVSPPMAEKEEFFEDLEIVEEEQEDLQGRPLHKGGPDISLNLAGNILPPITIHELFFSLYFSRLVYLNLWDTNLGIWGAQSIGGLMADRSCRIQYLNLGCNRLGFEGIVQLSGIYKNDTLVELDLSENHLGPKGVHFLQQIIFRLQKDKACNIRRLNLSNNDINDVGCISIAKILIETALSHLDLSFNKISDWGASKILAAFETKQLSLKDINMEANLLSFAGGVDICKILTMPQSQICHLDLRGAKVTDVGVPYLAEALKSHQCPVRSLNLYDCQLTDTGILKLAIKLSVNKSLRVLGLGCNCIGDSGVIALSQGLYLNNYLEELDLSENDMALSRIGLKALMAAMQTNTTLLDLRLDVDGHPHVFSNRDYYGMYPGFDQDMEYHSLEQGNHYSQNQGYHHYQQGQQQQQQQQPQQQLEQHLQGEGQQQIPPMALDGNNSTGFFSSTTVHVGEVLAPTHAALAQPLQLPQVTMLPQQQQQQQQQVQAIPGVLGAPPQNEEDLERERQHLQNMLASLKSYVRFNRRRTTKLRKLCFEILAMGRILMFAKDSVTVSASAPAAMTTKRPPALILQAPGTAAVAEWEEADHATQDGPKSSRMDHPWELTHSTSSAVIPTHTGLPTPPLVQDKALDLGHTDDGDDGIKGDSDTTQPRQESLGASCAQPYPVVLTNGHGPPCTLTGLPWEIKEMILRALDRDGLLSDRQFQTIMNYCASNWETKRHAWDRWGEIRETILEKTRCYYYEP